MAAYGFLVLTKHSNVTYLSLIFSSAFQSGEVVSLGATPSFNSGTRLCRAYLHVNCGGLVYYFVPTSDVQSQERRPFECLLCMGHKVHVASEPRRHVIPQVFGQHLYQYGAIRVMVSSTSFVYLAHYPDGIATHDLINFAAMPEIPYCKIAVRT